MRKTAKLTGIFLAVTCASGWAADASQYNAGTPTTVQGETTREADNTGINTRDRDGAMQTPQTQSNDGADRELLAAVRQEIVADDTLSMAAHNVKIITKDGVVTLRGPVGTADEKGKVEKLALQVAGVTSVANELDVDSN